MPMLKSMNMQWLIDAENDDHALYDCLINNIDSESPINIDSTEVVMDVNVNIESANDI